MKKLLKNFIASAVCKGIEQYVNTHRFGMQGTIEMIPLTHDEFEKHLLKNVFQGQVDCVKDYLLETTPITAPQLVQNTK